MNPVLIQLMFRENCYGPCQEGPCTLGPLSQQFLKVQINAQEKHCGSIYDLRINSKLLTA